MKKIFTSALILFSSICFAQHETDNWHFGTGNGVSFMTGLPVDFTGAMCTTLEGSSSMSDAAGNVLLYTDGQTVYNAMNATMPNGTGLMGAGSSTQSALIVPDPGNADQYYVFTTADFLGANGFRYSIVDMTLQGGLGDVTAVKNVPLLAPCDEKLTGIRMSGQNGFWIVVHANSAISNEYYSYPLTAAGVGTPVISAVGPLFTNGYSYIGQMKISPDGIHIARAFYDGWNAEIADFDQTTGMVSNPFTFNATNGDYMYGVEFSSTGNAVYFATGDLLPSKLFQLDMRAGNSAAILASAQTIFTSATERTGALQIASNGKIYASHSATFYLGVINDPDILGTGCNYEQDGDTLLTNTQIGLPNFLTGSFIPVPPVVNFVASDRFICPFSCIDFTNMSTGAVSYQWYFPGANPDTSTAVNPMFICYDIPGMYSVTLVATNTAGTDSVTLTNMIHVYPQPVTPVITQVGNTLVATSGFATYQWYYVSDTIPGATNSTYYGQQNGNYNLAVTDSNGCQVGVGILNVIFEPDGMNELTVGNLQLAIYPNPAHDMLYVSGQLSMVIGQSSIQFEIYNSIGEKIYSATEKNVSGKFSKEIPLGDFAKGVYNLQVKSSSSLAVKKFIIDK
jgi:PKD repeat protein